jgi:hypothetical protein
VQTAAEDLRNRHDDIAGPHGRSFDSVNINHRRIPTSRTSISRSPARRCSARQALHVPGRRAHQQAVRRRRELGSHPEPAIATITLMPGQPVFSLNTLGDLDHDQGFDYGLVAQG